MTLVVFSFGLLPLIVLFQSSYKTTAQAKNLMVVQTLGRTIIDEVRALGFDGIRREITDPTGVFHGFQQVRGRLVESDSDSIEFPSYYQRFETKLTQDPDDDKNPKKYRIELEIQWQEPDRKFSLGFGTVVVKYGAK